MNFDFIRAVNDRLEWDGIWEGTVPRVTQDGRSLYDVLDEACNKVGSPHLLILPWSVACALLQHNHEGSQSHFRRDLEAEDTLLERGYIGHYREATVVASIYADDPWGKKPYGIVASVHHPSEISYAGENCALIYFDIWQKVLGGLKGHRGDLKGF